MILSSLDESWDNLVISLENIAEENLHVAFISGRLVEEEQRRHYKVAEKIINHRKAR